MGEAPARQPCSAAAGETDDAFLGGRLQVLQPRSGYRAGIDGVLLAATVQVDSDAQVLDVRKTPGLFVNGKPLDPFGAREFKELVESELRANYPELTR